jgi:hypothetical protein
MVAIDLNDEVKLWAGFTAPDFWIGAGVLAALFFGLGLGLSVAFRSPAVGLGLFFALGGPWIFFWLYQRSLPKGFLLRRWRQEGRFLFILVTSVKGTEIYSPPALGRGQAWDKAYEASDAD